MDDPSLVRFFKTKGDLPGNREDFGHRNRTPLQSGGDVLAFDQFHHESVNRLLSGAGRLTLLEPEDRRDVGVIEGGEDLGLATKAGNALVILRERGGQNLDGHVAVESRVARAVHLAHPPRADGAEDFVGAEPRSRVERHGRRGV